MPSFRNRSQTADEKRLLKSFTGLTSVSATGVFTLSAGGFLDDLQAGDIVRFSTLTGGSSLVPGQAYYLVGAPRFTSGQTTFQVATTPTGAFITHGSNVTVGTVSAGSSENPTSYVSPDSVRGR